MNVLQDCFTCGVLSVGSDGSVTALTPEAERVLRLDGAEGERGSPALPAPVQAIVRDVQTTGRVAVDRQVILRRGSGSVIDVMVTAVPVGPGTPPAVVVILKLVCSSGKLDYYLHRLDRLASIGTLSASMAHEIKNALVPIRTFVDLLLEKDPEAELAGTVRREMHRVDTIVSRMLKFAVPAKPAFSSVRLHEILDHSLRLVQHQAECRMISFDRRFEVASDSFSGDDHQLEQAFVNLLLNALEAMGSEGALTVSTEVVQEDLQPCLREGGGASRFLCVKIADTGMGIPPEHVDRIFEPFFTTKQNGTGLGLSVTRRIIEEHNGVIRVESQPGKGTTFAILLPAGA